VVFANQVTDLDASLLSIVDRRNHVRNEQERIHESPAPTIELQASLEGVDQPLTLPTGAVKASTPVLPVVIVCVTGEA
jgi:hypothetical protein